MKCKDIELLLSPYLEDNLSPEDRGRVQAHLASCEGCSSLLGYLKEIDRSLGSFPEIEPSRDLMERIYSLPAKKRRFRFSVDVFLKPALQPLLAAASVLMILVSLYAFHPERAQFNRMVERQFHQGIKRIEKIYAGAASLTASIGEHKDNFLSSLKDFKLFRGKED